MGFNEYVKTFQLKVELGLDRIKLLLEKLGNPQNGINLIHVAGTNGKGSVCAFLEKMLLASGASVGVYSSPELYKKNEVIRFNGENISDEELDALICSTKNACDEVEREIGSAPSQFEVLTACAFMYLRKAEYVIMEVGMGGEGDATNVCDSTKLAVITKISLDHVEYLGDSVEKIAEVKAGIIKKGCSVVTTASNSEVMKVISDKCELMGADLQIAEGFSSVGFDEIYEKISFGGETIKLSLGGVNQLENAAIATQAARALGLCGRCIKYGLENALHKGRFEKISDGFYFDGAHNVDGMSALSQNVKRYFSGRKIIYIMGSMKDKDVRSGLELLKSDEASFKFVTVDTPGRAMEAKKLLEIAEHLELDAVYCDSLYEAYSAALKEKGEMTVVIACGSLYFYKDFKNNKIF